ncbi:MAG: error-prone DNA polymerase [Planctomycetes bacterium]|nr:error-prone DNA polymerase [Planctomycetota bacterium]MBI3832707.1 error-prone DNA polymerase [Planctomycetota bacterium]
MPDLPHPKAHAHPYHRPATNSTNRANGQIANPSHNSPRYVELAVTSNFTFLRGASHPDELVHQAAQLHHAAIAVTDWNSLAGVVRAHVAAKEAGIPFIVGCRLVFTEPDWLSVLVYPTDRAAYGRLCRLLTLGKRRAPKGECHLTLTDLREHHEGLLAVAFFSSPAPIDVSQTLSVLRDTFDGDRLSLAITRLYCPDDAGQILRIQTLSEQWRIPLVAVNDVHYHVAERHALQDVLTCIRHTCTLSEAGFRLFPNGERYLKAPDVMARLFVDHPEALARTIDIADRVRGFNLDQLRYEYPDETCSPGLTPMEHLRRLTWQGANDRYPQGVPDKVRRQIEYEFALIEELQYATYFLTVHDLVRFARSQGILCQGRGAAANSAVCFCLGVTSVDPDRINMLFERFVSRERDEPPDIDIDFEHERREEVIQYIYGKYGRERAALTAEVITYRRRSAVRNVGKALGLSLDAVDHIAKRVDTWEKNPFTDSEGGDVPAQLMAFGFDANDPTVRRFVALVREIIGFPRHLSQHVGGFVMTRGPLCELVPIENAAMDNRTVIEWDKDDIEALGMLKVDVLGLGMLTCIRKAMQLIEQHHGRTLTLATIPSEDPVVYDMIGKSDTLGVFQIESRAQMTMLPRLKPRCFYDLVIEVAIVRPGPIVGEMVHPYLRRRVGEETFEYPNETIREVLGRTLGVPLFQEQVMALAIKAAGFTPGEAEKLRRAITAWTSKGDIANFPTRFVEGMVRNGYDRAFAEWCFKRFKGFSQYGFPESHAASFALLVYASAWIKCYYPAVFAAALLNSQPMGFYAPAQIVRDTRDHGVEARAIDVNKSEWDCAIEEDGNSLPLGMRMVNGLREREARKIIEAVEGHGEFSSPFELWRASAVSKNALAKLARADAFRSMQLNRRRALWEIQKLGDHALPLFDSLPQERSESAIPIAPPALDVGQDYAAVGLSLKGHPVSFIRKAFAARGVITAAEVKDLKRTPTGRFVTVAGIVLFRQRPGTAKGVMFMTIEDETGRVDLIVRPTIYERYRDAAVYAQLVLVRGVVEHQGQVLHVMAKHMRNMDHAIVKMPRLSRDFR